MGWNNQNVTSLLIINASGGFTGLFVYNPSPGTGNLIASVAAQAGTDPYGNPYQQGIAGYGPAATGVSQVNAQCWGPSGGSSGNRTTDTTGGSSGGGGEFASQVVAVTPGHTYTVVVGTGGTAGVAGGAPGGTGTSTTFTGDSVTVTAHSGGGGVEAPAAGGPGGTGSTNTIHHDGGAGAAGSGVSGSAGGGSSAGPGAPGNPGAVNAGGIAPAGGGNGANGFPSGDHAGAPGSAPGGGPSGPLASTTNEPGAAGTAGQVILTWGGGSQTFTVPGTFQWTAPTGVAEDIVMNAVSGALSLFFYTGAPSDVFPGAHLFAKAFNPGQVTEQIELAIIGPTSTASPARADIQLLSDVANQPGVATGFLFFNDIANAGHDLVAWGGQGVFRQSIAGLSGGIPLNAMDFFTRTANTIALTALTTAYPIPADDASVPGNQQTTYHLRAWGTGNAGNPAQTATFSIVMFGTTIYTAGPVLLAAATHNFTWIIDADVMISGNSATASFIVGGFFMYLDTVGGGLQQGPIVGGATVNNTAAGSMVLDWAWTGVTGGATISCPGSVFTRKGV